MGENAFILLLVSCIQSSETTFRILYIYFFPITSSDHGRRQRRPGSQGQA